MKKTKIICSIGPSTQNWDNFKGLVEAGMNVARINFSHATIEERELDESLIKSNTIEENIVTNKEITKTVTHGLSSSEVITVLPSTTEVNDTAGKEYTVGIEWSSEDYDSTKSGWYTFVGNYVNLPDALVNKYSAKITAKVFVSPKTSAEVKNILAEIENLNSDDYTLDSWNALTEAKTELENVLAEAYPTQELVDEKSNALKEAYNNLSKKHEDTPTEPGQDTPTEPGQPEPTPAAGCQGGCGGSILTSIFGVLTLVGSVMVLRRKRKE